jgi:choline dehydrogenase
MSKRHDRQFDFVIVGSGAGGGPLAANLARAGFHVLLLEAGDDHGCLYYDVPIMHARASEDVRMGRDFFVRHYSDDIQQRRDSKFVEAHDGVLYPRGSTLGGSTAISALVTVYPHNSDWDRIADITGDLSWRSDNMRRYFQRLEHWVGPDASQLTGISSDQNSALHGYDGWLHVSLADPKLAGREPYFLEIINAMMQTSREKLNIPDEVPLPLDPNDWRVISNHTEGMSFIPLAIGNGVRNGARERIANTQKEFPEYLVVQLNSLVTKVLFDNDRAIGVEYMQGRHLFRSASKAHQQHEQSLLHVVFARREVILAGGAFNTPQLLKLSGIGPRAELQKFGIQVVLDAPGVGENLQDRYEVGIVNELINSYSIFNGVKLDVPAPGTHDDPLYAEWEQQRTGPYATNGTLAAIIKRSSVAGLEPDLFVFAIPGFFRGYYPGYSAEFAKYPNALTWLVLKAHTNNRAGRVLLRSIDPHEPPIIEFNYFTEGNDTTGNDLEAVVDGVELARDISSRLKKLIKHEIIPGPNVRTRDEIRTFVRDEAWGHHASCTCKIGASDDPTAVLDSSFRVRGIKNLRVVDASVFPYIPGFFILSAVYMISEKASEILISEHGGGQSPGYASS